MRFHSLLTFEISHPNRAPNTKNGQAKDSPAQQFSYFVLSPNPNVGSPAGEVEKRHNPSHTRFIAILNHNAN